MSKKKMQQRKNRSILEQVGVRAVRRIVWAHKFTTYIMNMGFSSLVPRPSIAGGRPGIHCLRMHLISPKILENRISRYSSVKR